MVVRLRITLADRLLVPCALLWLRLLRWQSWFMAMKIKHLRAVMFDLQAVELQGTPIRVSSTIVCLDITAALAVGVGNDFTQDTVKQIIVQVRFLQRVCTQT
jgi:hypothetical protein